MTQPSGNFIQRSRWPAQIFRAPPAGVDPPPRAAEHATRADHDDLPFPLGRGRG